jgi:hypothetical protein
MRRYPAAMTEPHVMLIVDCPGCKKRHDLLVKRSYLQQAVNSDEPVQLYCVNSDKIWYMSETEKENNKQALAKGII